MCSEQTKYSSYLATGVILVALCISMIITGVIFRRDWQEKTVKSECERIPEWLIFGALLILIGIILRIVIEMVCDKCKICLDVSKGGSIGGVLCKQLTKNVYDMAFIFGIVVWLGAGCAWILPFFREEIQKVVGEDIVKHMVKLGEELGTEELSRPLYSPRSLIGENDECSQDLFNFAAFILGSGWLIASIATVFIIINVICKLLCCKPCRSSNTEIV